MKPLKHRALLLCALTAAATSTAHATDLEIKVHNIQNNHGSVWLVFYDNAHDFLRQKESNASYLMKVPARKGSVSFTLHDIRPGQYAGTAFHDENSNGAFDLDGTKPKEAYAYTNNVGKMAIPSFPEATVTISGTHAPESLDLIYP